MALVLGLVEGHSHHLVAVMVLSTRLDDNRVIHSGTGSSVKVSVAVMGNLLHGSVWSFPTQQRDDVALELLEIYVQ